MSSESIRMEALDDEEKEAIKDMPVHVAIGWLVAKRKNEGRVNVVNSPYEDILEGINAMFNNVFKDPKDK